MAWLVFSDRRGAKRRPVLVIHDFGDDDLLVAPVTSQAARIAADVAVSDWQGARLKLPSVVRVEKLATVAKSCVARKLGALPTGDLARVGETLTTVFKQIPG